jgi:hypothetical protein
MLCVWNRKIFGSTDHRDQVLSPRGKMGKLWASVQMSFHNNLIQKKSQGNQKQDQIFNFYYLIKLFPRQRNILSFLLLKWNTFGVVLGYLLWTMPSYNFIWQPFLNHTMIYFQSLSQSLASQWKSSLGNERGSRNDGFTTPCPMLNGKVKLQSLNELWSVLKVI